MLTTEDVQGIGTIQKFGCTVSQSTQAGIYSANMLLDCDGEEPHNETTIAVHPSNPLHAVGVFHIYLLNFNGSTVISRVVGTPSVTLDGGLTWTNPITVARGKTAINPGPDAGPNVFNDKEFIAADASATSPYRRTGTCT